MLAGAKEDLSTAETLETQGAPLIFVKNAPPRGWGPARVPASLRALLTSLIDYAGLFPPAGLGTADAVRNYANYLKGEFAWVLGRFVVPADRLVEFVHAQSAMGVREMWKLSCLVGPSVEADVSEMERYRSWRGGMIDCIEARAQTAEQVARLMAGLPGSMTVYFEVPPACSVELLAAISRLGARAKIRTGGVTPDAIPPSEAVAAFMAKCASAGVAFKATAGLHHPLRSIQPLTYEANAPMAKMHGFLNAFLAAALAYEGASAEQLTAVLNLEEPERLRFEEAIVSCGDATLSTDQVQTARELFAVAFGSCSFEEPLADLRALRLL